MTQAHHEHDNSYADEGVLTTPEGHALPRVLDPVVSMALVQRYVETERNRNRRALLWISGIFLLTVFLVLTMFVSVSIFVLRNVGKATDIAHGVQAQTAVYAAEVDGILNKMGKVTEGNEQIKVLVESAESERSKKDRILRTNLERFSKWISSTSKDEEMAIMNLQAQLKDIRDKAIATENELKATKEKYEKLLASLDMPSAALPANAEIPLANEINAESTERSTSENENNISIDTGEFDDNIADTVTENARSDADSSTSSGKKDDASSLLMFPNGEKYEGEFRNGLCHGWGVYYYANGDKYEGEFDNGLKHGRGTFTHKNGDKYIGEFVNDMMTGKGTLEFRNGDKYVGDIGDGMMNGKGTLWYKNGNKYIGDFKNGMKHGNGQFSFQNGDVYKGGFSDDFRNGSGTYSFADGSKYIGEFFNGRRHGKGRYVYGDGAEYIGDFVDGKKDGIGVYVYPNGKRIKGLWQADKFVRAES